MDIIKQIGIIIIVTILIIGCSENEPTTRTNNHVTIVYMCADNDLNADAWHNIEQMKEAFPSNNSNKLIIFLDLPDKQSRIIEIGFNTLHTVREYENIHSTNPLQMRRVLTDIITLYPSLQYGLILWSHGSSWIPANAVTRSFGNDQGTQMDIIDLADALPLTFEFILFDACLMGSVEVAYQLRHKGHYMISSSTETLFTGFPYDQITPELLSNTPDYTKIANSYFNFYQNLSGIYQSATISVIDLSQMEILAQATHTLLDQNIPNPALDRIEVQRLDLYEEQYQFDFRDYIEKLFPQSDKNEWLYNLDQTVIYKACTSNFMNEYNISTYCGLGCYIPLPEKNELNQFYKRLDWYTGCGLNRIY